MIGPFQTLDLLRPKSVCNSKADIDHEASCVGAGAISDETALREKSIADLLTKGDVARRATGVVVGLRACGQVRFGAPFPILHQRRTKMETQTHITQTPGKSFTPWNKGEVTGQKPPLKPREVWAIRVRLQISNRVRDLALFNLAIDSKLRGCDLVHLRVEDVMQDDQVRTRALVAQRKTGAPVQFEITEQTRAAIANWVRGRALKGTDWLFPSRVDLRKPMTTRQYGRLVDEWIAAIGLSPAAYGISASN